MCNTHVSIKVKNCLYSIYTCRASINCLVPDLAMVPRLLTRSALVIPIPVSMNGQGVVLFVGNDCDLHLFLWVQNRRVRQTLVADLVQCLHLTRKEILK